MPSEQPHDPVTAPRHYQLLPGVQVIDVRKAILDKLSTRPLDTRKPSYYQVDCWSRAWEYLTRCWGKNELEDLEKSLTYLTWLIEDMKKERAQDISSYRFGPNAR